MIIKWFPVKDLYLLAAAVAVFDITNAARAGDTWNDPFVKFNIIGALYILHSRYH
jgi:hypothetical protein